MSGGAQSQFLSALRFFELIDEQGTPSEALSSLAMSEDEFGEHLQPLIRRYYNEEQLQQLATGSPASLAETFPRRSTSVVRKICRFFISAAQEASLEVSPHLVDAHGRVKGHVRGNSTRKARTRKKTETPKTQAPSLPTEEKSAPTKRQWQFRLPDNRSATLTWPADLTKEDVELLWKQLESIRAMLEVEAEVYSMEPESD